MKKIIAMFKGLPPEMRMLIAMAGLGTPLGMMYAVQRFLFPGIPMFYVIIGCAVVIAVVCALGVIISKLFGGRAKKRRQDMERELSSAGPGGPVGMDARAAIKDNNEKFFNAIRDMRKTLGLSVYDLPWYVVLGDSGCGKTKLINEGGLVFSTGRPEGYQLGTLNYNWWFTEDAIFIDMAGRLCNPQEDADRREWTAFLDTVAKGRKGYPINGAVVCVSADHLLADPPEKQEQDANTMLERLRDLQNRLGVTFATYLVLTKCDKILGFMPFFDRPGKDITFKNQMFGWSKPGAYNELVDPEKFDQYFDELYQRLCELRLRRISEDADELELGLAYTFPEEFRTMREPLKIYLRTLFPAIKNPKAVKNLLFRGLYLTSATQEGEMVLKHLRQRLGEDAARQFQSLESLYPQPRPHFVKDLLVRKVIPENGLVFRNEQEVARNRKLAKLLTLGSGVLSVLLILALVWSFMSFDKLINNPRLVSRDVTGTFKDKGGYSPETSLAKTLDLGKGVNELQNSRWAARVLSLGIGTHEPIRDLTKVEMRLFEEGVLRPTLRDVEKGLRSPVADQTAPAYRAALLTYVKWVGCSHEPTVPDSFAPKDIEVLAGVITESSSPMKKQPSETMVQVNGYFASLKNVGDDPPWPNPAGMLTQPGFDPVGTITDGMRAVYGQFQPYAKLTPQHPDYDIGEWMRIAGACRAIQESYAVMVGGMGEQHPTLEKLKAFSTAFTDQYKRFDAGMKDCVWRRNPDPAASKGRLEIPSLREAIMRQRNLWVGYEDDILKAYKSCGRAPEGTLAQVMQWLKNGDAQQGILGLDATLANSLREDVKLTGLPYDELFFDRETFSKRISEIDVQYKYIIKLENGKEKAAPDSVNLTSDSKTVADILAKVNSRFTGLDPTDSQDLSGETLAKWKKDLPEYLGKVREEKPQQAGATVTEFKLEYEIDWKKKELESLLQAYEQLGTRSQGNRLLSRMEQRLKQLGAWGVAEAEPDWRVMYDSPYRIASPAGPPAAKPAPVAAVEAPKPVSAPVAAQPERRVRRPGEAQPQPTEQKPPTAPEPAAVAPSPAVTDAGSSTELKVPAASRAQFLNMTLRDWAEVRFYLKDFGPADYLSGSDTGGDLPKQCLALLESNAHTYLDQYVRQWAEAYTAKQAPKLKLLEEQIASKRSLEEALDPKPGSGQNPRDVGVEVRAAVVEVLRQIRWVKLGDDGKSWDAFAATDPSYREDFIALNDRWRDALSKHWPQGSIAVADGTREPSAAAIQANEKPWETAGREIQTSWEGLVSALQDALPLPVEFKDSDKVRAEIPWDGIKGCRNTWWLDDEKFTTRLAEVIKQSRQALNLEMSRVLAGVQNRYFSGAAAYGGWPYINPGGSGEAATDTVAYDKFRPFLWEVGNAERTMSPLEKGMDESDANRQARARFYGDCSKWGNYLGKGPDAHPTPMTMVIKWQDPKSGELAKMPQARGIDDTAQHYYSMVELALGLTISAQGGDQSDMPLKVSTLVDAEKRIKASWVWTASANKMTVAFKEPIERANGRSPEMPPQPLGKLSPLSFCAYLHRYGQASGDQVWVTAHAVNLADAKLKTEDGKSILGVGFKFELDQPMPPPITQLMAP